jgi:uncharacterized membrane protein
MMCRQERKAWRALAVAGAAAVVLLLTLFVVKPGSGAVLPALLLYFFGTAAVTQISRKERREARAGKVILDERDLAIMRRSAEVSLMAFMFSVVLALAVMSWIAATGGPDTIRTNTLWFDFIAICVLTETVRHAVTVALYRRDARDASV